MQDEKHCGSVAHLGAVLVRLPDSFELEGSQDWLDPLVGARATFGLSERLELTLRGDVADFAEGKEYDNEMHKKRRDVLSVDAHDAAGVRCR